MSASVVPARAGMSPGGISRQIQQLCGPRASGDEPAFAAQIDSNAEWSPRERG